ncbi:MAG: MerR family transcriptional regulator [Chitinophagaceae bacterium]
MDNQLSLFGFEEAAAPQPSKSSDRKKMDKAADPYNKETQPDDKQEDLFARDAEQERKATVPEDTSASAVEITVPNNIPDEAELNEIVVPNQETPSIETLLHNDSFDHSVLESKEEMQIAPALSISETSPETAVETAIVEASQPSSENPITEGLDEVAIPNQEVQIAEEQLEEEMYAYPFKEEPPTEETIEPLVDNSTIDTAENAPTAAIDETPQEDGLAESQKETVTSSPSSFGKKGRKSFKEIDAEVDLVQVPSDEVLFSKQYYPISQVAKWFRVNNSLLRFWENEFDILKPRKNRKGDRLFRPEDVKNLQVIYYLLRQKKYTIAGARKYIKNNRKTVDVNMKIIQTLGDFKKFLLELKANTE